MKHSCLLLLPLLLAAGNTNANASTDSAKNQNYGSLSVGVSKFKKDLNYNKQDISFSATRPDSSHSFSIVAGKFLNDFSRIELRLTHFFKYKVSGDVLSIGNNRDAFTQNLKSTAVFIDQYFDFNKLELVGKKFDLSKITPFLTYGFGVSRNSNSDCIVTLIESPTNQSNASSKTATTYPKNTVIKFAWNFGLGFAHKLNEKITIDLINYKVHNLGSFKTQGDVDGDTLSGKNLHHNITTGIRINF